MFLYQPPQTDRKIKAMHGRGSERKLDRTIDHLTHGGLPINPAILKNIKRKLAEGTYKEDRDALVEDIKLDPALYLFITKQLNVLDSEQEHGIHTERQLKVLDEQQLQKLFHVTESDISVHRTRNMSKAQALRLQHSIVSSRAAEAMAKGSVVEPEVAYSSALFRQLGLNLIAWNYPEIYSRTLRAQKTGASNIEDALEKTLGVSPMEIGAKLAAEWNLSPEIRRSLTPEPQPKKNFWEEEGVPESHRISLHELCELSELCAQASDPEHYVGAQDAWAAVEPKVKEVCGVEVSTAISDKVKVSIEAFESCSTQTFTTPLLKRIAPSDECSHKGRELFECNIYLQRCIPALQDKFLSVYKHIEDTKISVTALKVLAETVIPHVGFLRGCLYLLDDRNMLLKPALRFGDTALSGYQAYKLYQNNLITTSLDTTVPIKQDGPGVDGELRERICGGLGSVKRPGVLYLEIDHRYFEETEIEAVVLFQAIRQALLDTLNYSQ